MRFLIALLLVPAIASAAPKFTTAMTVRVEGEAAGFAVTAKLDACWRKTAKAKAKVTVENGKITKVEIVENGDPRAKRCLEKGLRAATTDATAGVVATIELESAQVAVMLDTAKNRKMIDVLTTRSLDLGKFTGVGAGEGGTGMTRGTGVGGGGTAEGELVAKGSPRSPEVKLGPIHGGSPELERVVKSRAGVFRACYQKELNRSPKLAGSLVVTFTIATDGSVSRAAAKSSTLPEVEKCIVANVQRLRFPVQSAAVDVTYPFAFSN